METCPLCGSTFSIPAFWCKDNLVSGLSFPILDCSTCNHRFTGNMPPELELGKYYDSPNYISHTDSKQGLFDQIYQAAKNINLKTKYSVIRKHNKQVTSLLDYGCGTADFLYTLQSHNIKVYGIEPDSKARNRANQKLGFTIHESLEQLNPATTFDCITLWHVLEHVPKLNPLLTKFNQLLTSKGTLVIAVPNYTSQDSKYYNELWAAYDVPRHIHHFNPTVLQKQLELNGFLLQDTQPMHFDPYYISILSEKNRKPLNPLSLAKAISVAFLSTISSILNSSTASSIIYTFKKQS